MVIKKPNAGKIRTLTTATAAATTLDKEIMLKRYNVPTNIIHK